MKHQYLIALFIGAVVIFAALALSKTDMAPSQVANDSGPAPDEYNIPAFMYWNTPKVALPSVSVPSMQYQQNTTNPPTCGCSGSAYGTMFSSFNKMADYFTSSLTDLQSQYVRGMMASMPDVVSQYFNIPVTGESPVF